MSEARAMGDVSRRINGVRLQIEARADAARAASKAADDRGEHEWAAALRGKAGAYAEAAQLLVSLDQGKPLRRRHRWLTSAAQPGDGGDAAAGGGA